jgi:hypothetical protein
LIDSCRQGNARKCSPVLEITTTSRSASVFRGALDLTVAVLESRIRRYREAVVAVVVLSSGGALLAVILRSVTPLCGILFLPCLCGFVVSLDAILVNRWRARLLSWWCSGALDVDDFCYAMTHMRHLPSLTVHGMVTSLPSRESLGTRAEGAPVIRHAIAESLLCIHFCGATKAIAAMMVWAAVGGSAAATITLGNWESFLGLLLIVPSTGAALASRNLRIRGWRRVIRSLDLDQEGLEVFINAARRLDWESMDRRKKETLLNSLRCDHRTGETVDRGRKPGGTATR